MSRAGRNPKPPLPGFLSRKPVAPWPHGILHHGARVLLLVLLASLITTFFPPEERQRVARFEVGDVAEETVLARIAFAVPKTEDELARERAEVRAGVPPTFDYHPEAADSMVVRLDRFFAQLDTLGRLDLSGPLIGFLLERSVSPTASQLELIRDPFQLQTLWNSAIRAAQEILPAGVADASELENLTTPTLVVRQPDGQVRAVSRAAVLSPREFYERGVELLPPAAGPELQQLLRLILIQHIEFTFELNVPATELDRDAAARAVPTTKQEVAAQEAIVRANDQIRERDVEVLEAYASALERAGLLEEGRVDVTPYVGATLLNVMFLTIFGLLLFFYRPDVYTNFRWVLLIVGLAVAYFAAALVIARNELPHELLPVAFVALGVAVLWDGRLALGLVAVLAVLTGLQQPFTGVSVIATTLLAGAAAALSVRAVRRRAQTWVFIAIIISAYTVGLLALAMIFGWEPSTLGWALLAASVNAALSAILAMGFVPVFEFFTGITTDQTLLEWADPNRALLRRLSMEAPGTYAHTINVANLAEAAANSIGANGLLCRVGLYYHDVGKMLKPHYFVENQPDGRNPHDRLRPDTSAAIVKEHVVEGLRLAREANVPEVVAAFIPEHHGTQRISFFWDKAKEELGEEELDVEAFTYPGPRPRSKETALAMLADSVESATRALQDPTSGRVRDLIENIVEGKIRDGQLDEAPLTLREIRQIKEQFIKVLSGIYHHRIDYPQTRHLTESSPLPPASEVEGGEDPGDDDDRPAGGERGGARAGDDDGLDGQREGRAGPRPGTGAPSGARGPTR